MPTLLYYILLITSLLYYNTTSAYVSNREHTSAYVSTRQHTSASVCLSLSRISGCCCPSFASLQARMTRCLCQHAYTSAYISICPHTSSYVSICQHTSPARHYSRVVLSKSHHVYHVFMSLTRGARWDLENGRCAHVFSGWN